MSTIAAWLLENILQAGFSWLYAKLKALFASQQDVATAHADDSAETSQDTEKLEKITQTSSAKDIDEAVDEATKHL